MFHEHVDKQRRCADLMLYTDSGSHSLLGNWHCSWLRDGIMIAYFTDLTLGDYICSMSDSKLSVELLLSKIGGTEAPR